MKGKDRSFLAGHIFRFAYVLKYHMPLLNRNRFIVMKIDFRHAVKHPIKFRYSSRYILGYRIKIYSERSQVTWLATINQYFYHNPFNKMLQKLFFLSQLSLSVFTLHIYRDTGLFVRTIKSSNINTRPLNNALEKQALKLR